MIKAGDLVMVTRPWACCGHSTGTGLVFIVHAITEGSALCGKCMHEHVTTLVWMDDSNRCPASRLIKIDPPAIPEQIIEEAVA